MPEFELHRVLQKTEEPFFLFGRRDGDAFTFLTAQWAEKQRLAAFAPHHVDARVAHDFFAMRAFIGGLQMRVARTQHRAVGQNHRRLRTRTFKLRNGDVGLGGFDEQFHVAQAQILTGHQPRFLDGIAVDERAVGGVAIAQKNAVVGEHQFAVMDGDGGMIDGNIALRIASHMIYAQTQFQRLLLKAFGFDQ